MAKDIAVPERTSSFSGLFIRDSTGIGEGSFVGNGGGNGEVCGNSEISCNFTIVPSSMDELIRGWARLLNGCGGSR